MAKACLPGALALCLALSVELLLAERATCAPPLRAGAAAVDINPQSLPVSSNGGMLDRQVDRIHDPLMARALVLESGETRVAIVICDSCLIPREIFDAAKAEASRATGIPSDHMLMAATHSHTAVTAAGAFQSEPDPVYLKLLTQRIAEAVKQAASRLEPARVGWGHADVPQLVFNRRWFMKPGYSFRDPFGRGTDQVVMNPPRADAALDRPAGPTDPEVSILAVRSADGRPIAVLANYALHYVGGVPENMLSADYFGEFSRLLAARLSPADAERPSVVMMSNGTSGNVNNIDFLNAGPAREPFEQIRIVALAVSDAVRSAYEQIEFHESVPIAMREREIELGVRLPSEAEIADARRRLAEAGPGPYRTRDLIYARETVLMADYPATVRAKLQVVRIGDLAITTTPCETFVETGLALKRESPLRPTFTIELANGYNGYLPTPEHHKLGGYETWRARSAYLATDAEPKVRATLLEMLGDLTE